MTSFVHIDYAQKHPGVQRAESVVAGMIALRQNFDAAHSLATMLLAAVVAALVVVADRLIDSWADGHLLMVWVALWAVAFAAIGLLAPIAGQAACNLVLSAQEWSRRSANARAEDAFWQNALNDPRVMAEYQAAKQRSEQTHLTT